MPRSSSLGRRAAEDRSEQQILAANVETVFIVSGMDRDFNIHRIERYLTLAYDSGAVPVVVLNKLDLVDSAAEYVEEVEAVAFGTEVVSTSGLDGTGVEGLRALMPEGSTSVFVGSSGAGKSSLVNRLMGSDLRRTGDVRGGDGKGRHVSVDRMLLTVPGGGCIIDTPGLREVGLTANENGLASSFADITELAVHCRFNDCSHEHEPGCAVRAAIDRGELSEDRLESYRKQLREIEFYEDRESALEKKREWHRSITKQMRQWKNGRQPPRAGSGGSRGPAAATDRRARPRPVSRAHGSLRKNGGDSPSRRRT
jgi:ribosome biogenesis GTPase